MDKFNALTDFKPRKQQLDFLKAMESGEKKYAFLRWHRQFGKDLVCWLFLIRHAIQNSGSYYYFFPMLSQAKKALWNKNDPIMGKVRNWIPRDLLIKERDDEMFIEIKTIHWTEDNPKTSTIYVAGADSNSIDNYTGISPNGVVFSEVAINDSFPLVIGILLPTIIANNAWLILNSTPRGRNHFHKWEEQVKNDPDWFCSIAQNLWPDREHYTGIGDPVKIRKFARAAGWEDWMIEREHGVSYEAKVEGSYLSVCIQEAEKHKRLLYNYKVNPRIPVSTFWDIGIDDDTVVWFKQDTHDGEIVIDYWEGNGVGTDELARMLIEKGYYYDKHQLPWDGVTRTFGGTLKTVKQHLIKSLRDFRCTGSVLTAKRDSSRQAGIVRLREEFYRWNWNMQNLDVSIGFERLRNYKRAFNKTTQTYSHEPAKNGAQHAADAARNMSSEVDKNSLAYKKLQNESSSYIGGEYDEEDASIW